MPVTQSYASGNWAAAELADKTVFVYGRTSHKALEKHPTGQREIAVDFRKIVARYFEGLRAGLLDVHRHVNLAFDVSRRVRWHQIIAIASRVHAVAAGFLKLPIRQQAIRQRDVRRLVRKRVLVAALDFSAGCHTSKRG